MDNRRFRLSRLAGYTLGALAAFLVGLAVNHFLPGSLLGVIQDIGAIALVVLLGWYLFLGLRWTKRRLLWKVRNKIIVSFAFVGIIPLVILLLISTVVLGIALKRLSGFYLEYELATVADTLDRAGQSMANAYLSTSPGSRTPETAIQAGLENLPAGLRNVSVDVYSAQAEGRPFRYLPEGSISNLPVHPELPLWLTEGFSELTSQGETLAFTTVIDLDDRLRLVLRVPLDDRTLEYLRRHAAIELAVTRANPRADSGSFQRIYSELGGSEGWSVHWAHFVQPVRWEDGRPDESWSILLAMPAAILVERFFAQDAGPLFALVVVLLVVFVIVEIVSLLVGSGIARSITHSIGDLYAAVESIQRGNFSFRIPSRGKDQFADMAESFNEMSESIVTLMNQVSHREWLEKELEIAREVQNQLFPQQIPVVRRLQIAAHCMPARQVSGDYYDFLVHSGSRVDIVVGDISGKGISAALLMASLQSAIRSRLTDFDGDLDPRVRMAEVVRNVNRQLYRRSSPESFSTLVLNHFDGDRLKLYYCNAGHHPPLVFSDDEVVGLTTGGTVVGLFENWEFDAGEVSLRPGDLVVYFTDGVVEAVNQEGEQYGTDRLVEVVRSNRFLTVDDVQALILDQVFDWTGDIEQADDITVVCLKVG